MQYLILTVSEFMKGMMMVLVCNQFDTQLVTYQNYTKMHGSKKIKF
jgi:hypothetical protein